LASGHEVGAALQHEGSVRDACFSSDGRRVLTASDDGVARIWNSQTGSPVTEPMKHGYRLSGARFTEDESRVVTYSHDGKLRAWNIRTGQQLSIPLRHDDRVRSVQFSSDGRNVVTSSRRRHRTDLECSQWSTSRQSTETPCGCQLGLV
jgi:WD40 repeat protein